MNIGLVTYDFHPPIGGQGVESYELYRALRRADIGARPIVFSSAKNSLQDHVEIPGGTGATANLRFSFEANRLLPQWVREHQLKAVQAYGGPGGVFLVRKPSVPFVYVANHTYSLQSRYFGHRPAYRLLQKIESRGYALADAIVAISSTTAKDLCEVYGVAREQVTIIPPGIDLVKFSAAKVERDPFLIVFVGRLDKRKGISHLLRAMALVLPEFPDARLAIAGTGPMGPELRALAEELHLTQAVEFLGRVPEEELVDLYRRAGMFVLPSIFEGFGIALAEAMACGTPVVATDVAGIVDVVKPGEGELVPPADVAHLARALANVLRNPAAARARAERARERVCREFSIEGVGQKFLDLYQRLGVVA